MSEFDRNSELALKLWNSRRLPWSRPRVVHVEVVLRHFHAEQFQALRSCVLEGLPGKLVFQLVMPEDADATRGLISTTSPIGRAFLNKEPGDTVKVTTPGGSRQFDIVKLITIHDEAQE